MHRFGFEISLMSQRSYLSLVFNDQTSHTVSFIVVRFIVRTYFRWVCFKMSFVNILMCFICIFLRQFRWKITFLIYVMIKRINLAEMYYCTVVTIFKVVVKTNYLITSDTHFQESILHTTPLNEWSTNLPVIFWELSKFQSHKIHRNTFSNSHLTKLALG